MGQPGFSLVGGLNAAAALAIDKTKIEDRNEWVTNNEP
jgi:hypothetical protein